MLIQRLQKNYRQEAKSRWWERNLVVEERMPIPHTSFKTELKARNKKLVPIHDKLGDTNGLR
jgi:hypothetical protein